MSFSSLGLIAPLLTAIEKQGYDKPSPIQEKAIAPVLEGRDVMAAAQTGTGKTAAFTLPLLQRLSESANTVKGNHIRALVLTPTRELAAQVADSIDKYNDDLKLRSYLVYGGVKINPQMMKLRRGNDVLVATPGRLLDLYQQNAIKFHQLEILVLDEADRMLDMGFIHDIKKVLALLPKERQNLLFSATFSDEIRDLARNLVNNPVEVSVTPPNTTVERIEQRAIPVDKSQKTKLLIHLVKTENWFQVLVFCRTKMGANRLTANLNKKGISAAAIHGNKSQNVRTRALADFKQGDLQVLVATDIAARGIDIAQLPFVVNYDLPNVAEDYVHRIGRTGRAGKSGLAISFVTADDAKQLAEIERLIQLQVPRQTVENFEPVNDVPNIVLPGKPKKPKKPKKKKVSSNVEGEKQKQHGDSKSEKAPSTRKKPNNPRRRWKNKPKNAKPNHQKAG